MTNRLLILVLILVPVLANAQAGINRFKDLYQLSGIWSMETKRGLVYESWQLINATEMQCRSYRLNGTDTLLMETVRLIDSSSVIYYIPTVNGQNNGLPVVFREIPSSANEFIFENKAHDFPQRVAYKFIDSSRILARIEGERNGQPVTIEFPFTKVR